jgi:hypothetical protein
MLEAEEKKKKKKDKLYILLPLLFVLVCCQCDSRRRRKKKDFITSLLLFFPFNQIDLVSIQNWTPILSHCNFKYLSFQVIIIRCYNIEKSFFSFFLFYSVTMGLVFVRRQIWQKIVDPFTCNRLMTWVSNI